jgi:hypothetical protein
MNEKNRLRYSLELFLISIWRNHGCGRTLPATAYIHTYISIKKRSLGSSTYTEDVWDATGVFGTWDLLIPNQK